MEAPVELQPFDPQGTGPQGSGGIPPEEFTAPLQDQGVDLVGAGRRPEDSAAAQAVLAREAENLAGQLGVSLPPSDRPMEPQAPAEPATPEAAQPHASAHPGDATSDDDLRSKLRNVTKKFGGNFGKLAEAYVRSNAEASRMASGLATENAQIRGELAALNAQVSRIVGAISPQETRRTAPEPAAIPHIDDETFREKPAESVAAIVDQVVSRRLGDFQATQFRAQEQERLREIERQNQTDIERLRPKMAAIYQRDPDVYNSMGETRALSFLLERAKERELAEEAAVFYAQVNGLEGDPNAAPAVGAAPPLGAAAVHPGTIARSGPVSARARMAQQGAPNGDWSSTPAMRKLYGRNDGSVNEHRSMVDVLRERGIGEHLG